MWTLTDAAKDLWPIAGVPWNDMEDEEFEAVSAEYDERNPDFPPESLKASGFFEQSAETRQTEPEEPADGGDA